MHRTYVGRLERGESGVTVEETRSSAGRMVVRLKYLIVTIPLWGGPGAGPSGVFTDYGSGRSASIMVESTHQMS